MSPRVIPGLFTCPLGARQDRPHRCRQSQQAQAMAMSLLSGSLSEAAAGALLGGCGRAAGGAACALRALPAGGARLPLISPQRLDAACAVTRCA